MYKAQATGCAPFQTTAQICSSNVRLHKTKRENPKNQFSVYKYDRQTRGWWWEGGPIHFQFVVVSIHHAFLEQNKQFLWAK
jgi:hypothetical protein